MHVAITGASSGIGRALALEFSRRGAKVTLVARRRELLDQLAKDLSGPHFIAIQDLSDTAHAADWIRDAEEALGPIEVLINNAGVMHVAPTATFDPKLGMSLIDLNLVSPMLLTQAVLPGMLSRGAGTIVNVASLAAMVPLAGSTWYGAAKAGLAAYSTALRAELRGAGVNVLTVFPGPVDTPLAQGSYDVYGRTGAAAMLPEGNTEALAALVHRAVVRKSRRVIYPRVYAASLWFPFLTRWFTDVATPKLGSKPQAALPR